MELTRIYKLIPYLLIILALGAIAFFILTGQTAVLIKSPILILLAFIIGSIFIILTKKHHSESVNIDKIACLNLPQRTLRRIFVITAALMMVITILGFKDSVIYIVLLVTLALCIILQILSRNVSAPWVIGELLYVVAMFIFPLVFSHEYYYDGSDIIYHSHYIDTILQSGFLNLFTSEGSIYAAFPGLHIGTAITSLFTLLPSNESLYIFMTLAFLGLSIFVYLISKQIVPSLTIALLALYVVFIPAVGTAALTTYAPFAFFSSLSLFLLYLLFRKKDSQNLSFLLIGAFLIVYMTITHHATNLALLGILLFFLIIDKIIIPLFKKYKMEHEHVINLGIIILYLAACGSYIYYLYLNSSLTYLKTIFSISSGNNFTKAIISYWNGDLNILDTISSWFSLSYAWLCIIPALIGMYLFLTHKYSSRRQYFIGFFMLIFFIIFSNVYSAIPGINNMNASRFYGIIFALFATGVVYGLCYFCSHIHNKFQKKYLSQGLIIGFCLLLLLSPCIAYAAENEAMSWLKINKTTPNAVVNEHFSTGEMVMINFSSKTLPENTHLSSDSETNRYLSYQMQLASSNSILNLINSYDTTSKNNLDKINSYIIFRKEHFENCGFSIASSGYYIPVLADSKRTNTFAKNTYNYNIMYTNGGSIIYST